MYFCFSFLALCKKKLIDHLTCHPHIIMLVITSMEMSFRSRRTPGNCLSRETTNN